MQWMIIKYLVAALLIGGVILHFKLDRDNRTALGAAKQEIAQLKASLLARDADNLALNDRIRARNEVALKEVAEAEMAQALAKAEATKARADKARSDERLAEAQRKYREILNANENVRTYSATVVPDAVFDRLRSSNGEAGDSAMRTGRAGGGSVQADPGRLIAWLQLPISADQWQHQ